MTKTILMIVFFINLITSGYSQSGSLSIADTFYFKGEFRKAIPYYKKALGDTSKSALLWQRLAYSNYSTKQYEDALFYYTKSLALRPNPALSGIIYANILNIYQEQNKPDAAISFLKQAAENGFSNLLLVDTSTLFRPYKNDVNFKKIIEKIRVNNFPCLSQPHGNDFDFWVGEWDVYVSGTNNLIGRSSITKVNGGCVILENWTSLVSANTGISMNFIDPVSGKWMQDYSGSGGTRQLYIEGEYKDTAMRFAYQGSFNNAPYPGHFIFYNEGPNQVRQYQDYSIDGGKSFVVGYNYTYKRRK